MSVPVPVRLAPRYVPDDEVPYRPGRVLVAFASLALAPLPLSVWLWLAELGDAKGGGLLGVNPGTSDRLARMDFR